MLPKMALLKLVFITLMISINTLEATRMMGPLGNIIINSISDCEESPVESDIKLHVESKIMDEKGTKSMTASIINKIPIDNSLDFEVEVRKQEGGSWKLLYTYKGKFCTDIQKYCKKLWQKIRDESKPPIVSPCPVNPGTYVITNFQATTNDASIPAIFYGKLMLKLNVKKSGKLLACAMGDGISQAPSLHL